MNLVFIHFGAAHTRLLKALCGLVGPLVLHTVHLSLFWLRSDLIYIISPAQEIASDADVYETLFLQLERHI